MLNGLAILRSGASRLLFIAAVVVTAGVLIYARYVLPTRAAGLSGIFVQLFVDFDASAAGWTLVILLLAVFISGSMSASRLLAWISKYYLPLAGVAAVLLCAGSLVVYLNHPLSMDEYAQYFQSQVFAAGKLSGNFPTSLMDWLVPPAFQNYFLSVSKSTGAVASGYWPSFALLLTPFSALGIPWACNPVISALTLVAAYRLAIAIYGDRDAAAWVVLLTLTSPEFFVNGITYYSMPAHLLANTVFALLLVDPTRSKAVAAGIVGSIALTLHNPFPHMLFALPWFLWVAGRRDGTRLTLSLLVGYFPLCFLLGFGWFWYSVHLRDGSSPTLSVFSLPDAPVLLARGIGVAKTWVWSVPGLIILAISGAWKGWPHPVVRVLTWSALCTLLGFFLVPVDQGHGWGYRYFHTAWIVLPLLAAGALTRTRGGRPTAMFEDEDSRAFVLCCAVLTLLIGGVFYSMEVRKFITLDLAQMPAYAGGERRVVIINSNPAFYSVDLVQNDPWLRGNVVRMISHGRENDARMMGQSFPGMCQVYEDSHGAVWSMMASGSAARHP